MSGKGMMNLEKCQSLYNGNIFNIKTTVELLQASVGIVGVANGFDNFELVQPATANLDGSAGQFVLIYGDELMYEVPKNIADFSNPANVTTRGYVLTKGDIVKVDKVLVNFTATHKFLIPQDGSFKLVSALDWAGVGTASLVFEIVNDAETIGYDRASAIRARVVKC